jgi:hypothetical protein
MAKYKLGRARGILLEGISYPSITATLKDVGSRIKDPVLARKKPDGQVKTISERLIEGWTAEQAFGFEPPPTWAIKGYSHPIVCAGTTYKSERALARAHNIPHKIVHQRLHRDKMTAEAAVNLEPPGKNLETLETLVGCIYILCHRASGRSYVGLTIDHPRRASRHFSVLDLAATKPGTIQHAIATYGKAAFEMKILEDNIPGPQLAARERHWIKEVGSLTPNGFNQNAGGVVGGFGAPVVIDGIRYLGLARVAESFGITLGCLIGRLKLGWSLEEAVNLRPRKPKTRTPITLDFGGRILQFPTVARARRELVLSKRALFWRRYKLNQSWEDAIRATLAEKIRAEDAADDFICNLGGIRPQRRAKNVAPDPEAPALPTGQAA